MNSCFIFKCFCFALFLIEGSCQSCTAPSGSQCIPIGRPPASCITKVDNGTNLTWFDMQENCGKDKGRLVWLSNQFSSNQLTVTETSLTGASFTTTELIMIGLLQSIKGDDLNFWRNPEDKNTLSCGTEDTDICLPSSATEKQCNMIGCCWLHGKCQYPERQWFPEKNGSDAVDTSALSGISYRSCVGLQKSGKDWTFKAFDCSMTSAANTGYVCEYKCKPDWETRPLKNVTWQKSSPPGGSATAVDTGTTGTVIITTGRNRSGQVFDNQAMITTCAVTLLLILYQATFYII